MGAELKIPDEAEEFRFYCSCGCGRMGFQLEGVQHIVAAEVAADTGLEVLREMAARVDSDSGAMALVGAVLRYVDDRRRRASELRGEGQ